MNRPQEIIMYRNPMEYDLYNSGVLFPIMVSAAVAIAVTVVVGKLQSYFIANFTSQVYRDLRAQKRGPFYRMWNDIRNHIIQYLCVYAGAIAAVATFMKMTN